MRVRQVAAHVVAALALALTGCAGGAGPAPSSSAAPRTPVVIASTTWVAALARAAGAADVTVVAPAGRGYQPDFQPSPADLAPLAQASFVLYAESDAFAGRLRTAAGRARLVPVTLTARPETIRSEVTGLGQLFGTESAAADWLSSFDTEYRSLTAQLAGVAPIPPPSVVADRLVADWAAFAGVKLVGQYGPGPSTPAQVAALSAKRPRLLFAAADRPGDTPRIPGTVRVDLVTFPGADLDLLKVLDTNAQRIGQAFAK